MRRRQHDVNQLNHSSLVYECEKASKESFECILDEIRFSLFFELDKYDFIFPDAV